MAVCVKRTYTQVTVKDKKNVAFPAEVIGGLEPGSLDHLCNVAFIEWGINMTDPIEHDTIPKCCHALLLPISYKHPIDDTKLPSGVLVYVHRTNLQYAPRACIFNVWADSAEEIDMVLPNGIIWASPGQYKSNFFEGRYIRSAKYVSPEPTPAQPDIAPDFITPDSITPSPITPDAQVPAQPTAAEIAAKIDRDDKAYYAAKYAVISNKIRSVEWVMNKYSSDTKVIIDPSFADRKLTYLRAKRDLVKTMMADDMAPQ